MSPNECHTTQALEDRIEKVLDDVREEVLKAMKKHKPINGPHEGYAVLLEEVDELWDEVKPDRGRQESARKEAIQVSAMGIRYVLDVIGA